MMVANILTPKQREVIEALKSGATLSVLFYGRNESRWMLKTGTGTQSVVVSGNTIKALVNKGLIVRKSNYKVFPYDVWVELTEAAQS